VKAPLRLLIVDDHAVVRRGIRAIIEGQPGWEIAAEAANGREAIELAKRLHPDIVVMDLSLPGLNGLDATRQVLEVSPRSEVLILTMHHSDELVRNVLQVGARGFVLKSDADENLVTAIESLAQHKPFLTANVTEFVLDDYVRRSEPTTPDTRVTATPREREIIQLLAEGMTNKEIAALLGLSVKTVEAHRANIMRKLHFKSLSDLVRYAIREKLVQS
jgi:DNA-binding NarL/FixJ family response regulator